MNSLWVTFLNESELICLHTVKWYPELLFKMIQLNVFKHCYLILMIQFNINHLVTHI